MPHAARMNLNNALHAILLGPITIKRRQKGKIEAILGGITAVKGNGGEKRLAPKFYQFSLQVAVIHSYVEYSSVHWI